MKLTFVLMALTGATIAQNCQVRQILNYGMKTRITSFLSDTPRNRGKACCRFNFQPGRIGHQWKYPNFSWPKTFASPNPYILQPRPESLLVPDGHCDNGEGWACTGEIVGEFQKISMVIMRNRNLVGISWIYLQEWLQTVLLKSVQADQEQSNSVFRCDSILCPLEDTFPATISMFQHFFFSIHWFCRMPLALAVIVKIVSAGWATLSYFLSQFSKTNTFPGDELPGSQLLDQHRTKLLNWLWTTPICFDRFWKVAVPGASNMSQLWRQEIKEESASLESWV